MTAIKLTKFILLLLPLVAVPFVGGDEVLIQSEESKTTENGPVFNKIKLIQEKDKDIWMMNQAHKGLAVPTNEWDRVALVVDKTQQPMTAKFYQLEPGPLEWNEKIKKIPFKVSCFMCHSNGPRLFRADGQGLPLSLIDKTKLAFWNMKIKSYGRVLPHPDHELEDKNLKMPFRWSGHELNETLQVKTCTKCHNKDEQGELTKQNFMTIRFMIEQGYMPPQRKLSDKERQQIEEFIN